jgi:hypothetical protein
MLDWQLHQQREIVMCDLDQALDRQDREGYNHAQGMSEQQEQEQAMKESQMRSDIEYALLFTSAKLPDWFNDHAYDYMTQVFVINSDQEDDKDGRMRDLTDKTISQYCDWLVTQSREFITGELHELNLEPGEYL